MGQVDEKQSGSRRMYRQDFFGRENEITWFATNLSLAPDDPERKPIISVTGEGGIGKSWLMDEWRACAEDYGYATVKLDQNITSPTDAMYQIASQLVQWNWNFKKFNDRYDYYLRHHGELERFASQSGENGEKWGELGGRVVSKVMQFTPAAPLTVFVDPTKIGGAAGKQIGNLHQQSISKANRDLILYPQKTLSTDFLSCLSDEAKEKTCVLFLDAYDQTVDSIETWLAELLSGYYGKWTNNCLVVIASRIPLKMNVWVNLVRMVKIISLKEFDSGEVNRYLRKSGIENSDILQKAGIITKGLPLLVNLVASQQPISLDDFRGTGELTGLAYDRIFGIIQDPKLREVATHTALARNINQDILATLFEPQKASAILIGLNQRRHF
ncbi:MAG TPA: AAA family ATPase [Bellilinea sp.]|nr:AAA family ATPase [Bellilinea sp.]